MTGGTIEPSLPDFSADDFTCWLTEDLIDGEGPILPDYDYHAIPFQVSVSGFYRLVLYTDFGNGAGAVVDGTFDPFNPCTHMVKSSFSFAANPALRFLDQFNLDALFSVAGMEPILELTMPLTAGRAYELVTTALTDVPSGNYRWLILNENTGQFLNNTSSFTTVNGAIQYDLLCTDFDSLFARYDLLGLVEIPPATDNCGTVLDLVASDDVRRTSVCGPSIIERTFTAADPAGNVGSCTQLINVRKPIKSDIMMPPEVVYLDCADAIEFDEFGNPHPNSSGFPYIWTAFGVQSVLNTYCNVAASYDDKAILNVCESSYSIVREWTVFNWCNLSNTMIFTQVIHVEDVTPPSIDLTGLQISGYSYPDTFRYSTEAFTCAGNFQVPLPEITDDCGANNNLVVEILAEREVPIVDIGVVVGTFTDTLVEATITEADNWVATGIPQGCYWFRYVATDDCGNQSSATYPFCVEDIIAPVAVCGNAMTVSIGGEGLGRILATNVDQGSFDACGVESVLIRRTLNDNPDCGEGFGGDGIFRSFVDFSCCDVGKDIDVEMQVTDIYGNKNSCWVTVSVEDKINPICTPPKDVVQSCNAASFDPTNIDELQAQFGTPDGLDNCVIDRFVEFDPVVSLDDCGAGTIFRTFQVFDEAGNASSVCSQTIELTSEFNYEIKFPKDRTVTCEIPTNDSVLVNELACELIAIRANDEVFNREPDACFKIFRTYTVINWCEYEDTSSPVVISRDEDCNNVPGDQDVYVLRRPDNSFIDADNDETNSFPAANTKSLSCDGTTNPAGYWRNATSNGFWQYTQVIKVVDDTDPAVSFTPPDPFCSLDELNCTGEVTIDFQVTETCSPEGVSVMVELDANADGTIDQVLDNALSGSFPNYTIQGTFPLGDHLFRLTIEDGCGNVATQDIPFSVVDCKAPGIICIQEVNTSLNQLETPVDYDNDGIADRGATVLYARDFVSDSGPDCSGEITYSINRVGEVPSPDLDSIIIFCADSASVTVEVMLGIRP